MKNIHIIPTDNPSRIYLIKSNNKLGITSDNPEFTENFGSGTQNQHIYITNDEDAEKGDWCIPNKGIILNNNMLVCFRDKKIILTTDQDLIKDGVQAIDDEFLEWFVKNPSCEEVETKKIAYPSTKGFLGKKPLIIKNFYKIIIQKEESSTKLHKGEVVDESYPKEFKQETLEEVCDKVLNYLYPNCKKEMSSLQYNNSINSLKSIAKWQEERSYSLDEIKTAMKNGYGIKYFSEHTFLKNLNNLKKK
jgi:hypothetical protein